MAGWRYFQSDRLAWFADRAKWEGLQSVHPRQNARRQLGPILLTRIARRRAKGKLDGSARERVLKGLDTPSESSI